MPFAMVSLLRNFPPNIQDVSIPPRSGFFRNPRVCDKTTCMIHAETEMD